MYMLIALLPLLSQELAPDYATLLPAIVDYAAEEMFVDEGSPIPAAVHMGSYISLVKRATGAKLNVSAIAQQFAERHRNVSNRQKATECDDQGSHCEYIAAEPLFVELEKLSRTPEGVRVVVRIQADGPPGAWHENRFSYDFAWQGKKWIRTGRQVLMRS